MFYHFTVGILTGFAVSGQAFIEFCFAAVEIKMDDAQHLLSLLREGETSAGEVLLVKSGNQNEYHEVAQYKALSEILTGSSDKENSRIVELAAGVLANLMLWNDINDDCIEQMRIPDLIYECCSEQDDPLIICELLRSLINLVYVGKSDYIRSSAATLSSYVLYIAENSLSPKLLACTLQLVYYIQVYGTAGVNDDWNQEWNAQAFYNHLLGSEEAAALSTFTDGDDKNSISADEAQYNTAYLLQGEVLHDCTGLEWLLLSIDRASLVVESTTMNHNCIGICTSSQILAFVVHLLMSHSLQSWDNERTRDSHRNLGVPFTLSANEKFLLVSILENIFSYNTDIAQSGPEIVHSMFNRCELYASGQKSGMHTMLAALLDTAEEALLMRDEFGLYAAVYNITYLFGERSTKSNFLAEHMADLFVPFQNVIELIATEDALQWILQGVDQTTNLSSLSAFLFMSREGLLRAAQDRKVTTVLPIKQLQTLCKAIDTILLQLPT